MALPRPAAPRVCSGLALLRRHLHGHARRASSAGDQRRRRPTPATPARRHARSAAPATPKTAAAPRQGAQVHKAAKPPAAARSRAAKPHQSARTAPRREAVTPARSRSDTGRRPLLHPPGRCRRHWHPPGRQGPSRPTRSPRGARVHGRICPPAARPLLGRGCLAGARRGRRPRRQAGAPPPRATSTPGTLRQDRRGRPAMSQAQRLASPR